MKTRSFILIATFLIISVSGHAQRERGMATLQPKIGLNVANVTYGNADSRIGAAFGLEYEFMVADKIGISLAGLYSMQGDKCTGYVEGYGKTTVTEKIDYINFPALVNFYIVKCLAFKAGVQPGINVLARYRAEAANGITEETSFSEAFGRSVNTFDFSVPVGFSFELGGLVIDARYNLGIIDMIDYNKSVLDENNVLNSVWQFTIGYKIRI